MQHYGLVTEQSRKARAARSVYDYLKNRSRGSQLPDERIAEWNATGGIGVGSADRFRVLDLRLHDEHLSPYFKTDMNLFHLLMLDDSTDIALFRVPEGTLFVFQGLPDSPQPFGVQGYDPR